MERWGPDGQGAVYLSVYNASKQPRQTRLTIQTAPLGLGGKSVELKDQLSADSWEAPVSEGLATVDLPIPAQRARVLRLSGR